MIPSHPPFPKDVTLRIEKKGSAPAKVVVTRGKQKWETTDDKLDKLPADLEQAVKRFLGKPFAAGVFAQPLAAQHNLRVHGNLKPQGKWLEVRPGGRGNPAHPAIRIPRPAAPQSVDAQLKPIRDKLDALEKKLDRYFNRSDEKK